MTITTPDTAFEMHLTEEDVGKVLAHGMGLAWALKGDRATTKDALWSALGDAIEVIDAAPDRERLWLTSGKRTAWRMPNHSTWAEVRETERIRIMAGMQMGDVLQAAGRPRDVELAMTTMELLKLPRATKNGDRLVRAAVLLLRGDDRTMALKTFRPNKTPDRRDVGVIKAKTLAAILTGLEEWFGFVPAVERTDLTFAARVDPASSLAFGHTSPVGSPQSFS